MLPIVYVVRPGDDNEELRYSLRSLSNLPHNRVIVAGHRPAWVTNVEHVPCDEGRDKYQKAAANWRAACNYLAEPFLMFNDDYFVMRPAEVKVWHRGPSSEVAKYYQRIGSGRYLHGIRCTADYLAQRGITDPLSYSLHVPFPVDPAKWLAMDRDLSGTTEPLRLRTVYGNIYGIGGEYRPDVKVHGARSTWGTGGDFLSTSDEVFKRHAIGHHIRSVHHTPSPYEIPPHAQ